MKKRLATILLLAFTATSLVACGNSSNVAESKADTTIETEVKTETTHEHIYTEEVTTPATCLEEGEKTFTCECGDTYTEAIPATGHDFSNYVSNEDATYEADGTETATCSVCGETDTRVAEGSMLTYTFEDMEATKYAKSTVNVRSLPNTDGEKLGGLSTNDEVKVTGKCNETGWYRIEYKDSVAYVSDSYLVDKKVEVAKAPANNNNDSGSKPAASSSTEFPYDLYTLYDSGTYFYYYSLESEGTTKPAHWWNAATACKRANSERFATYDDWNVVKPSKEWAYSGYTLNGEKVMKQTAYSTAEQLQNAGY